METKPRVTRLAPGLNERFKEDDCNRRYYSRQDCFQGTKRDEPRRILSEPLLYPLGHVLNSTLSIAGEKVIETLKMDAVDLLLMRFRPADILLGKSVAARTGLEDIPISCGILAMNMRR